LNLQKQPYTEAKSTKFPGLQIDKHLKWEEHLNHVRKKILTMIFALKRTRYCVSEKVAFKLYYAYIFAHLNYLNPIRSSVSESSLSFLRVLQNKAIKIIKGYGWGYSTVMLYTQDILPLVVVSEYNLLLTIYKIKNKMLKCSISLENVATIHGNETRQSSNKDFLRTSLGQSNVFYKGLILFNRLPLSIKNLTCILS
jgi:hypothetical protein